MNQQNKHDTQGDHTDNRDAQRSDQRRNPRLVFADPDSFFRDLLMEQEEQS